MNRDVFVLWPFLLLLFLLLWRVYDTLAADDASTSCKSDFWSTQWEQMQNHLDENQKPCNDYYEYACGNWRVPYELRALKARDALTALKADNKRLLMEYFEQQLAATELGPASNYTALRFYNACVDDSMRTEHSSSKLKVYTDVLRQYSDWPLLNPYFLEPEANASFNWPHVSAQLRRYGVQALWRLQVAANWQASEQQIVYLIPPTFELLKLHAQATQPDEDTVFLYRRYVKYLLLDLGVRVRKANKIADEVVDFERSLLELTQPEEQLVLKQPQSLESLINEFREIALNDYFNTLLQEFQLPANYTQQVLVVADVRYMRRLARLLRNVKAETIAKYLLVQFLTHFELHLNEQESFRAHKEYCLKQLHTFLPNELNAIFLKLQPIAVADATQLTDIFEKLKVQFERMLNATKVFEQDAITKVLGLEKLRAMRLLLPNLRPEMTTYDFEVGDNYDQNLINLWRFTVKQQLVRVLPALVDSNNMFSNYGGGSRTLSAHVYSPLDVNAYYRLKKNAIEVPVGLLRAPFYDACLQPAKVYGGFVYILAHELLHGFDYDGLNYDKSGNVANNWGVKSIIKFGSQASCYLSARYKQAELRINENIADSEGLRLALETYLAYERAAAGGDKESSTLREQLKLFFLSFAQTWCGMAAGNATTGGVALHAEHHERVNNVLQNFPEFADAYECKESSPMHVNEKCRIW